MSVEWKKYVEDPRQVCKYGGKCYQKNPAHHENFKHPPNLSKGKLPRFHPYKKKGQIANDSSQRKDKESVVVPEQHKPKVNEDSLNSNSQTGTENHSHDHVSVLPESITFLDKSMDNNMLKELFLVEMPQNFFKFYETLGDTVSAIEKTLGSVNLEMIGPYDLLAGKLPKLDDKNLYLIHWRFYYDPPEFQAVLKRKGNSEFHIGYFRDSPDEEPVFVASNDSAKDCHITPMSDNLFGAVFNYLQKEKMSSPFVSIACEKLMEKLKKAANDNGYSLEEYNMKKRWAKAVTKTFHGAGIVVPVEKKTQVGYRHLVEKDGKIKEMFTKLQNAKSETEKDSILSELQPVITYANIAVDECDFGTGLELGIDLFCSGLKVLERNTLCSLSSAYSLLNRDAFVKIIETHLKHRRNGPNMSILSW
ncbi:histone PARylation factor 1 [Plodia interpunctella]|uniref:histone PARylation factor 1 n=1 Tax=Plodia interpunctella TaxID=58824 RepID=UPI0023685417|nr:histone PARylation factor 1 [Plodia interpunctella]